MLERQLVAFCLIRHFIVFEILYIAPDISVKGASWPGYGSIEETYGGQIVG